MERLMVGRWSRVAAAVVALGAGGIVAAGLPFDVAPAAAPEIATGTPGATPGALSADRRGSAEADARVASEPVSARPVDVEAVVLATETGSASYYANSLAGRPTASGVPYDPGAAVAAHRTLPFGTKLRVHNLSNGKVTEVEVVDRGPFAKGRILDLSRSAAEELDFIRAGHTRVRIEILEYGAGRRSSG